MSLTTYAGLQASIANWTARNDLTATIPDLIVMFEATANRRLRVRQMEASTTLTTSSGSVALPTDYLEWRKVMANYTTPIQLEYVHPTVLLAYHPQTSQGLAKMFTIEAGNIVVRPVDDTTTITMTFWQKVPALATNDPNWLLTAHPDLYLFGSLTETEGFTKDFEELAVWKARRDELFEEIIALSKKTQSPGAVRVLGPTP
jgi:hypothetical protein